MKTIKTFILYAIFFCVVSSYAQENKSLYYYAFDDKVEITPVNNKVLVKKKSSTTKSVYENLMFNHSNNVKIDWHGNDIFKSEFENENDRNSIIQSFLSNDDILSVSSIYTINDGLELGFTNEIVVKFKETVKDTERISTIMSFELENSETRKIYEIYTISKEKNIIEIANELYRTGLFEFVYPNIICKAELSHIPCSA